MGLEADRLAIGEVLHVDIRAHGLLVDRVLYLAVGLVGGADIEQLQRFLDLPFVRACDAWRGVDHRTRTHFELLAFHIAHRGVAGDDVVARFDRVPVELLVGTGLVGRAAEPHAVGLLYFRPTDQPLVSLAVGPAAPAGAIRLIENPQSRFHFHGLSPVPSTGAGMMPEIGWRGDWEGSDEVTE